MTWSYGHSSVYCLRVSDGCAGCVCGVLLGHQLVPDLHMGCLLEALPIPTVSAMVLDSVTTGLFYDAVFQNIYSIHILYAILTV